ncbi:MAG: hypothetical protein ACRDLS_02345 [Solirubrobacteraceae bacterium]
MSVTQSTSPLPMRKRGATLALMIGLVLVPAAPAVATNPWGPDRHANCTAGFAVGSTVDGDPGAVAGVAMPPKQYGSLSDVGYYSRTSCEA